MSRCYADPVSGEAQRILITGANGRLGQRLIRALRAADSPLQVRALVRSKRAATAVEALPAASQSGDLRIVDYGDADSLAEAAVDCQVAVHLVGVIRESKATSYTEAHEDTCRALTLAARTAGIEHVIYLSIFGADPASPNTCLASKGRAEHLLRESAVRTTILRIPMVLGPGDPSTQGLIRQARARLVPLARGGATLQQPIDTRDVVAAIIAAVNRPASGDLTLDLGGPESLSHAALIERTARILGTQPSLLRIPAAPIRVTIRALESLLSEPPITLAMFDVLEHDDDIDPTPACTALGIQLLPLGDTLRYCLFEEGDPA